MHAGRSDVGNQVHWLQKFSNFYSYTAELSNFSSLLWNSTSHHTAVQQSGSFIAHFPSVFYGQQYMPAY